MKHLTSFTPIWSDSLGAKSFCTMVRTSDVTVLIDPGVAVMQPSFPATPIQKQRWRDSALREIKAAAQIADIVIITHYHYDHFIPDPSLYKGKLLLAKNPNRYINRSQRQRAEGFFDRLCCSHGMKLEDLLVEPAPKECPDPMVDLPLAREKDFGDYTARRTELLAEGKKRFYRLAELWLSLPQIPEFALDRSTKVEFPEGRQIKIGKTVLRFTAPIFHGIEFSRVGWVFALTIEIEGEKLLYTSDVGGPIIEDYAQWIIDEEPDIILLDGPMTYMLGYTLNRINLDRAIANGVRIVKKSGAKLIIYDHHLLRDVRYHKRTEEVWAAARGQKVLTVAEYLGKTPVVLSHEELEHGQEYSDRR